MDMNNINIINSKRIDILTRVAISYGLKNNDSVASIAKELHFSRQAIYKEIKRGTITKRNSDLSESTYYDIYAAQMKYNTAAANKGRLSKIDDDKPLMDFIIQKLQEKYSPEVIAHMINDNPTFQNKISARTIYNWVYNGDLGLDNSILPYSKKKRKKAHRQEKNIIKPNGGESIELRDDISDRIEFGHWEIDCVVGKKEGKSTCLMTLVERKTRYGIVIKIKQKSKKCIVRALKQIKAQFGKYFYNIFKSITADNGSEFKDAEGMSLALKNGKKVKIYYAHAYCSWERGTNENYNRMVRRWYPKGTSFEKITQKEIDKVTHWINNYPRKQFNYRTSSELFYENYNKLIA